MRIVVNIPLWVSVKAARSLDVFKSLQEFEKVFFRFSFANEGHRIKEPVALIRV